MAEFNQTNDPIEPLNRAVFAFNEGADTLVIRPAAEAYRLLLPPEVRIAVRNVLANMRTPVILVNDLLQGNDQRAATTIGRFLVNTTVGIGGILDVATDLGLLGHTEDFGQTFAVWGAPEGPYLFVPILGPSNPRDLLGFAAGILTDPFSFLGGGRTIEVISVTRTAATGLDTREALIEPLDALRAGSLDPYATLRSAYRQRREAEIANRGERGAMNAAPNAGRGLGAGAGIQAPTR
jgi:phospholipid-binding lipoprotein MlaA